MIKREIDFSLECNCSIVINADLVAFTRRGCSLKTAITTADTQTAL
jgi:hypothetical protein